MASVNADLQRFLIHSQHPLARRGRAAYRSLQSISLPVPRALTQPMLWAYLAMRSTYYFTYRVFVCEPLFKAYCTRYGRRLKTDVFIHFIEGRGELIVGDDVLIDGKCCFAFSRRSSELPTLIIGDRSAIGHNSKLTVARKIVIGNDCRIASDVWMFDFSGHPSDPEARRTGQSAGSADVRPIEIGDNVWIGRRCIIFPGVTIGEGSIVSAGSVVMASVPANTIVAGNPARAIIALH